ncbi:hypothetical protein [Aeromonas veronii]|uniref:hypothetical protein n=1 Tax=Aeromonas veronii TaxID=654 RepID=UPI00191ECDD5|nr:hypothetical protein [Aeromonas veronii]MBL0624801.1 hypothetical protein [Aeromonas veronii]
MAKKVKGKSAREIGEVAKSQRRVADRNVESKDDKVKSSNLSSARVIPPKN